MQKNQDTTWSFQTYWWSKNLTIWSQERHNWPHTTESISLGYYFHTFTKHTDDQGVLQSDFKRGTAGHTQPKIVVSESTFPWWLTLTKKRLSLDSFRTYWWSKNLAIWLEERHNLPHPTKSSSVRCYLPLMFISMQKN